MTKPTLIAISLAIALSACNKAPDAVKQPSIKTEHHANASRVVIDKVIDEYTRNFMEQQPGLSTSLSLPVSVAGEYQHRWPDYSPKGMAKLQATMSVSLDKLNSFSIDDLSDEDKLHIEVNKVIAAYYQGDVNFPAGYIDTWGGHLPYIVNQISGPLIDIPKLLQDQHPVTSKLDATAYLTRLASIETVVKQVIEKVNLDAKKGVILPKALFPNTLGYLANFVSPEPEMHGLVTGFAEKLVTIDSLSAEQREKFLEQAAHLIKTSVYPAYDQVTSVMKSLEQIAPDADGIWAQPGGDKFYQHEILYMADSTLSPEKIHQIGLAEVARISQEMDDILKQQGLTEGSVGQRMVELVNNPDFVYEDSDEGRAKLLASLNDEIEKIMAKAPSLFATMPTQEVVVQRIPEVSQDGAAGGYYMPPALDGSRPGVYAINLKDMKAQPSFGLKTLTYHEAVPGHHFQISLNMAQTDIGIMRQNGQFNAFVEGWALYSEQVAYEMGMYEGDPWGNLGRLQAEVYRAARLVVDTGLHFKQWDRAQAIAYFHQATGTAMSDVEGAIDRYMAWPGQALGYKLGMLKIIELRQWAKAQLGEKFDIKVFHDLVLLPGARPLSLLEQDVKQWVERQKH